jgi:hypothetical protein
MAAAKMRGVALPPVELIQVGDIYFVRDGHHRISVARAFGQEQVDAEVTVWDVTGPLPRREPMPAGKMSHLTPWQLGGWYLGLLEIFAKAAVLCYTGDAKESGNNRSRPFPVEYGRGRLCKTS